MCLNSPNSGLQIALHTIASQLIDNEDSEVAFIDTAGSFSPWRLRDVITLRLGQNSQYTNYRQSGYVYERISTLVNTQMKEALKERAVQMLERVKVMRVFDFAGVVEASSEVRDRWERLENQEDQDHSARKPINEIPNSQDSDDEDLVTRPDSTASSPQSRGIRLIVIDNIANVTSSCMAISQSQGQALLTTFLRSLHNLTTTYRICTLMINAAVGLTPATIAPKNPNLYKRRPIDDNASIFSSVPGKPALGKTYAHLIDTSIFLSKIPKTKTDAEVASGSSGGDVDRWESIGIFEVLRDRHGVREGLWVTFEIGGGGVEIM